MLRLPREVKAVQDDGAFLALVGQNLAEGDARDVVDADMDELEAGAARRALLAIAGDAVRWSRLVRQFGGLAKVDRVGFYAASRSVICAVA